MVGGLLELSGIQSLGRLRPWDPCNHSAQWCLVATLSGCWTLGLLLAFPWDLDA